MITVAWRLAWGGRGDYARVALTVVACGLLTLIGLGALSWAAAQRGAGVAAALGRPGAIAGLALITTPALGFLVIATRLAAAPRDRRLTALRLVGATPWQARALAAVDGVVAALAGVALGVAGYGLAHTSAGRSPWLARTFGQYLAIPAALPYLPLVTLVAAVPVTSALVGALALNRTAASSWSGRHTPRRPPRAWALALIGAGIMLELTAQPTATPLRLAGWPIADPQLTGGYLVTLVGLASLGPWLVSRTGAALARRARGPVTLLAARRIAADCRPVGRMLAPIAVVVGLATTFAPLRATGSPVLYGGTLPVHATTLAAVAGVVALGCAALGLLVSTLESLANRRREFATIEAIGAPPARLRHTLLLRNAIPTGVTVTCAALVGCAAAAPALLVRVASPPEAAGVGHSVGLLLAVRLGVLAVAALTVAVTAGTVLVLPALRRMADPKELRYE